MQRAVCQILEYLIVQLKRAEHRFERAAKSEGDLIVCVNMASSLDFKDQLDCRVTTASAGRWSSNVQREELRKEIESMLGDISIPVTEAWEETDIFIDNLGPLRFQVTFQVCDKSSVLRKDCLVVGQFLHRIGVVHPQVKIQYHVKVNDAVSSQHFGTERRDSKFSLTGRSLSTERMHYIRYTYTD
nr:PREDICTED: uncharacterized protein C11orf80-like isoform X2 [Latimeria chalumnae]|eukprot:XP_014339549.1 PREDICTED: uncharacterized protein C11orf80-like isoform X2 [Latimeria chalumnae]